MLMSAAVKAAGGLRLAYLEAHLCHLRHLLGTSPEPSRALVAAMGHTNEGMTSHYIQAEHDVADKLREMVFFSGIVREEIT